MTKGKNFGKRVGLLGGDGFDQGSDWVCMSLKIILYACVYMNVCVGGCIYVRVRVSHPTFTCLPRFG